MCEQSLCKFEYKGMKTVGVTDYTNQTPPKHFGWKNVEVLQKKCENSFQMCTK